MQSLDTDGNGFLDIHEFKKAVNTIAVDTKVNATVPTVSIQSVSKTPGKGKESGKSKKSSKCTKMKLQLLKQLQEEEEAAFKTEEESLLSQIVVYKRQIALVNSLST